MKLEKIVRIDGIIEVLTGLHIGAGDLEMRIGGVDNPVIRSARTNDPYIPGSSLKGKIRSLLEWRSGAVQSAPLGWKDLATHDRTPMGRSVEQIIQLFGASGDVDKDALARRIGPTRVSFFDAMIMEEKGSNLPVTEVKSENMINRIKGVAEHPRQTERVASGVNFSFSVTVKVLEEDSDLVGLLMQGMRLLELDSLGGSGSRGYGKVKFRSLTRDGEDIQSQFDAIDPFDVRPGLAA
ncbi:MAG: type III-A CRISPR-associated RAMP protein Csm3 [Sphingomonadales bacterium]|nr:MAG: type III-A CRISPR-associated RAMP protein Csm3 [Sphingomonadales bacterium]